jgi:hypothetical protein
MGHQRSSTLHYSFSELSRPLDKTFSWFGREILKTCGNISEKTHRVSDDVETSKYFVELIYDISFVLTDYFLGDTIGCVDTIFDAHSAQLDGSVLDVREYYTDGRDEGIEKLEVEPSYFFKVQLCREIDVYGADVDVLNEGFSSFLGNFDVLPFLDIIIEEVFLFLIVHDISVLLGYLRDQIEEL